ncbi:MAG: hypothetical protein AAGD13_22170 [Pseudomonadota bacterium]
MTEITDIRAIAPHGTRPAVDWFAFIFAALTTPVVFGVSGILGLVYGILVTGVAAVLSLPAYVAFGLPAFFLSITRFRSRAGRPDLMVITIFGFLANGLSLPMAYAYSLYDGASEARAIDSALTYAGLGMVAAPVMALIFGLIYRGLETSSAPVARPTQARRDLLCA